MYKKKANKEIYFVEVGRDLAGGSGEGGEVQRIKMQYVYVPVLHDASCYVSQIYTKKNKIVKRKIATI